IPTPVAIHSFDTLIVIENDEFYSNMEFKGILKYFDPPGVANYYRLDCYQSYINEEGQEVKNRQYIYVDEIDDYLFDKSYDYLLWSDLLSDGKEVNIKFRIYFDFYYYDYNNPDTTTVTYSIMLNSISEDFYKYDKSRSLFYESGGSENPFSEPVLIYSNVINGYGVFGGYSSDTVSFQYTYNAQNQ
ncbi:MAG: DUF4249 family protein, partial [Bacteroidales bacterium]|nr:DUF4249 family protein [Bacteroidales bacterium]